MLTCSLSSQSRITCNDPGVVLNVRVWLRRPPRGPGTRTQTVAESFPTSRPATRSNMTSTAPPPLHQGDPRLMASVRRDLCQDTDPRALLATIQRQPRPPRHTPKRARPHQCVSTSPADPPFSSASAATRRAQPITPLAREAVRTVAVDRQQRGWRLWVL